MGVKYYSSNPINSSFDDWDQKLFMVNRYCFVITNQEPILVDMVVNASSPITVYEYIIVGTVVDTMLGIWIERSDLGKQVSDDKIQIHGNFHSMKVIARASFDSPKKLTHVFPDIVGIIGTTGIYDLWLLARI